MKLVVIAAAAALVGCAGIKPAIVSSTDRTVIVRAGVPDKGLEGTLPLAEAECAKRGRKARWQAVHEAAAPDDRHVFECVTE